MESNGARASAKAAKGPPPPPPSPALGARRLWRLSNLLMAVFFGLAGAVQVGSGGTVLGERRARERRPGGGGMAGEGASEKFAGVGRRSTGVNRRTWLGRSEGWSADSLETRRTVKGCEGRCAAEGRQEREGSNLALEGAE